jgi:hypothetical protein
MGSLGLILLMALTLPVSAAVAPMTVVHTIKITAPYTGTLKHVTSSVSKSGCSSSTLVRAPFFHSGTGVGGFFGVASSHSCASSPAGVSAVYASIYAAVPLVVLAGMNHITASWSINLDARNSLHIGTCTMPSGNNSFGVCYASAIASVYNVQSYVYDGTNGSIIPPVGNSSWMGLTSATTYYYYCSSGNCTNDSSGAPGTVSFHGPAIWHFRASGLVTSHSYYLVCSMYGFQYVDEGSDGGTLGPTWGSAFLNFGSSGDGARLNSIVIT